MIYCQYVSWQLVSTTYCHHQANIEPNKYTNYKEIKNNTNFGQITGIQEKLDTTCE